MVPQTARTAHTVHTAQQSEAPNWRIVIERPSSEEQPARFAVLRGERKVAWGLRDHDAAARWLRRLSAPAALA